MSEPDRAPDVDQPDGGAPSRESQGTGTTPHPDEPAEGRELEGDELEGDELEGGADTPSS